MRGADLFRYRYCQGCLLYTSARVTVLGTPDKWFGVTYKEDKQAVVDAVRALIDAGVYKEKLYSE